MIDIENLIGSPIQDIYCEKFSIETTGYIKIILRISEIHLLLTVDDETDEIIIETLSEININSFSKPLWIDKVKDKILMQAWGIENEKGYSDLVCLGLNTVIPTVIFSVVASEIKVGFVQYIDV